MGQVKRFTAKKIKAFKAQIIDWINTESVDQDANSILIREINKVLDGVLSGAYDQELESLYNRDKTIIRKDCIISKPGKTSVPYMVRTTGQSQMGDEFKKTVKKRRGGFILDE